MAQITLEIPENLANHLERLTIVQSKSVEQIALEHLRSLDATPGSPLSIIQAMKKLPHLHPSIIDEFEVAIRNGQLAFHSNATVESKSDKVVR